MPNFPIRVFKGDDFEIVTTPEEYENLLTQYTYIQAAGGVVRNASGDVLMIFRRNHWDLPKGKVEAGESVEAAALREVEEETGVKAEIVGTQRYYGYHLYGTYGTPMLKETVWFDMQVLPGQQLKPQAEEDISQAVWVPESEVPAKLADSYASIRELWEKHSQTM